VQLTYGGLNDRANRLAHRLQRLGIGPEVTVALGFERSAELIVSALAVWKAGGAFLPLDLSAPADRLALVVEDAVAPLVITAQATAERFSGCPARVLSFEVEAASLDQESAAEPHRASLTQNRAYVIYTSGSTGRPKGVEVQHSTLFNLIRWQHQRFTITPESRVNLAAIPAFDASIYEMWPYLTAGASVHVPPTEITPSAREMLLWIGRERITHGYLTTPQADRALAAERPEWLTNLRWILAGGDRLHQRPFRADSFDLINIYGPTEATVVTTYRQVTRMEDAPPRLPTIGGPLLNVAVHLLDHQLRPVPIGSLGELFIAGAGLARGYLGRPALTAERYVPHPFAEEPGARLYKTGDLVRYLPNGRLDFVGRTDHQVKIRGFRIELGEIEAVLAAHPEVAEAVVIVRTEATGPRLVAYLVPRDRASFPEVPAVREALRAKLPEYMVPSAFVVLDALPLTSRDKVDRNALPAPPAPGSSEGGDGAASRASLRSGTEERIAGVWREVLRIEAVGGEDNFFDLGGHSLAMVAIHERLQSELGRDFPLVEMFENPTIRSLALALDRFQAGSPAPEPAAERQDVQQRAEKQRHAQAWKDRARQARRTPR
jgi:amino acid adenylation domain-containing protein